MFVGCIRIWKLLQPENVKQSKGKPNQNKKPHINLNKILFRRKNRDLGSFHLHLYTKLEHLLGSLFMSLGSLYSQGRENTDFVIYPLSGEQDGFCLLCWRLKKVSLLKTRSATLCSTFTTLWAHNPNLVPACLYAIFSALYLTCEHSTAVSHPLTMTLPCHIPLDTQTNCNT